jgi:Protein of unknown function (DUF2958)
MDIFPKELRSSLPPLYSQEHADDPIVHLKFFTPDSGWTWFVTEASPEDNDFIFFGYVIGFESEWGYFGLSELSAARGPRGLPIERDLYFKPARFSTVLSKFTKEGDRE